MKLSSIFLFTTVALAAPAALNEKALVIEERQRTVTGTVLGAVRNVVSATDTNLASIKYLLQNVNNNIGVDIQAAVRANLKAIADALKQSTNTITSATTGAAGGIIQTASGLTQQEINELVDAVNSALDAVKKVKATIDVSVTDLTPDLQKALASEVDAVKKAINPFVSPLLDFARVAAAFSARVGITVTGLKNVVQQLLTSVNNLLNSLGLGLVGL